MSFEYVFIIFYHTSVVTFISGAKEAAEIPHSQSEMILTIMDEVRRQIGVVFPED